MCGWGSSSGSSVMSSSHTNIRGSKNHEFVFENNAFIVCLLVDVVNLEVAWLPGNSRVGGAGMSNIASSLSP